MPISAHERGRLTRLPAQVWSAGASLRLPHTDWLFHRLDGDRTGRPRWRRSVRLRPEQGTISWRLDGDSLQQDWFHLLVNPAHRTLSLAGARALAGQLRAGGGASPWRVAVGPRGSQPGLPARPARAGVVAGRRPPC